MSAAPHDIRDPWVGSTLAETYRIVRAIGEGGMGAVYEAEHTRLPRRFAIKVLRADYLKTGQWVERFRREAEISSQLRHPNIVEVVDYNHAGDGRPYIVMEFLQGEDLADRLTRGPLPRGEALRLLREVAGGLSVAHGRGVVHRDLKPQNIFLAQGDDGERRAKILDFGIAKLMANAGALTSENIVLGTPWYISPEQVLGQRERVDARSDLFSLAVIAYQLLLGQAPFASDSVAATLHQVAYEAPPTPRQVDSAFPEGAETVLLRALAKDQDERYDDAKHFVDALGAALEGRAPSVVTSAEPPSQVPTAPREDPIPPGAKAAGPAATTLPQTKARIDPAPRRLALLFVGLTATFGLLFVLALRVLGSGSAEQPAVDPAATSELSAPAKAQPAKTEPAKGEMPPAKVVKRPTSAPASQAVAAETSTAVKKPRRRRHRTQRRIVRAKPKVAAKVAAKPKIAAKPKAPPVKAKVAAELPAKPKAKPPKPPTKKPKAKSRSNWIVQPDL